MKRLILLAAAAFSLLGVTATPDRIELYMRAGASYGYSWYGTRSPQRTAITVSGTGSWNLSRGGSLATACGAAFGYCFNVATSSTATGGGALPTGSGPGTLYLHWENLAAESLAVGVHTGTLTVGSTVINITVNVLPRRTFDAFVYPPGFPSGCVNSFAAFPHADTCTVSNERPASTAFTIPAPGGSYVDPQFGHTVTRVTGSGQNIQYGALTAFSATAKYVLTSSISGQLSVYRKDGSVAYSPVPGININLASWDPVDDEKLWYMEGASLKYRILNTGAVVTAAAYGTAAGGRPAIPALTMGGTVDITSDGWWAFRDATSNAGSLCAVNLNGLTTETQEAKTFCASMGALGLTDIDFTQITEVDSESRKRYVIAVAAPAGQVFSVGPAGLVYEYAIPTGPSDVTAEPHSDVGADAEGRQVFFWQWYTAADNRYYLGSIQLSKGAEMTRPVEQGGGLRLHYLSDAANFSTDAHFGCTFKGVCVFTPYGNSGGISARQISAVTAGTPCAITTGTAHGYSTGAQVLIAGAAGITSINGVFTVTSTGSNTFTLDGHTCSGSYTTNSAHVAANVVSASTQPNRQEIVMVRLGQEVRRLAIHRSKIYSGGALLGYFATPRASISRDGRYVAFASNQGYPEQASVWIVDAGASMVSEGLYVRAVDAADTKAILNYTLPAGEGAATILISSNPGLTGPVVNIADGSTAEARQYVASGLAANTQYWYRIHSGRYAAQGTFRTSAALSGTGTLRLERGGGGSIQHGTTAGLGSSGASPLTVTVNRGVYYYDSGGGPQAVVVR